MIRIEKGNLIEVVIEISVVRTGDDHRLISRDISYSERVATALILVSVPAAVMAMPDNPQMPAAPLPSCRISESP